MPVKEKIKAFMAEYNRDLKTLKAKLEENARRLDEIFLEVRFIEEKEMPEAIERRVLSGDRDQETKLRKKLDKLQAERQERQEEQIVLSSVLSNFHLKKADDLQPLKRLFLEERGLLSREAQEKIMTAKDAYLDALQKETEKLHDLRGIEAELETIEVNAGRRKYVDPAFPLDWNHFAAMSLDKNQVAMIVKRLK